jgi:hypothetical protein
METCSTNLFQGSQVGTALPHPSSLKTPSLAQALEDDHSEDGEEITTHGGLVGSTKSIMPITTHS